MFIVTKEIDSENISKLCRTCLREDGDKMVYLFVGPAGSSLAAKLRSLSCLEVWQGDGLPEKMCDRCVTRAESALLYREQCRAADRALRQAALKVSGLTSCTTVSGCKLYQQNQSFMPVQNSYKAQKCFECGTLFKSYQELCAHSRLHLSSFAPDNVPVQHMHIVESQNAYLNFSQINSSLGTEAVQSSTQLSPLIRPNLFHMMPTAVESSERAACALHCSLCNHTFTNRTQLISHNMTHSTENIEISCDNENIEICDNSSQVPCNLSFDKSVSHSVEDSIRNLSYDRSAANHSNEIQNLNFAESIELSGIQESEDDALIVQNSTFSKVNERQVIINDYQNCSAGADFKQQFDTLDSKNCSSKKFTCQSCDKSFDQKSKLLIHESSHSGQRPFKCCHCERAYSSKSKLNAHVRLHTKTNVYRCKLCEKIFAYPSYLEEHMKTHNKRSNDILNSLQNPGFECSVCKKRFRLAKNLKAHEKLHTGKGLLRCEICDKQFSQSYNLKVHLQTHEATKNHKCEYCDKSFIQKGKLVEHLRIHTRTKPFTCKLCNKRFSQSSHLKSHEASHGSSRQHQCRLCGKRFKLSNHLKRHLNLHTGSKAYKCDQCNQMFAQSFSLKRHLKRHNELRMQ